MIDYLTFLATVVFVFYAFICGACFGSFLNVVVWRLPRKMPILLARSHCPRCKNDILASDNIPIWGWLRLKGRCRNCQERISIKYPLVEFAVAILFAILFLLIVVMHGVTLPQGWLGKHYGGWLSEFPRCPLFAFSLHQMVLGYILLAIALIDEDRMKSPWRILTFGCLLHVAFAYWKPVVGQIDSPLAQINGLNIPSLTFFDAMKYSLLGGVTGAIFGGLSRLCKVPHQSGNALQQQILLGIFLGPIVATWASVIAASSLAAQIVSNRFLKNRSTQVTGLPLQIFCAWLLILLTWRWWPMIDTSAFLT